MFSLMSVLIFAFSLVFAPRCRFSKNRCSRFACTSFTLKKKKRARANTSRTFLVFSFLCVSLFSFVFGLGVFFVERLFFGGRAGRGCIFVQKHEMRWNKIQICCLFVNCDSRSCRRALGCRRDVTCYRETSGTQPWSRLFMYQAPVNSPNGLLLKIVGSLHTC